MRRPLDIIVGFVILLSSQVASAQLVNDGVKIFISQGASVYVSDNVLHKNGEVLNNGELIVGGNWVNNNASSSVFSNASTGLVKFTANTGNFSGVGSTLFPKLAFVGNGVFKMQSDIGAFLSINLDDAELQTNENKFTLTNADHTAVSFKNGFVSTGTNGLFIRAMKDKADYVFPMGSSVLGLKRFVVLRPTDVFKQAIGVAFVGKDGNQDGYSRYQKSATITDINGDFYHVLKRIEGASGIDALFYTTSAEKFTSLINWTNKNSWEKSSPSLFQDNTAIVNGLNKSFLHQSVNLPLGMGVPFAFAQTKNINNIELFNAFSPDGDGKNDTWEIKNIDLFPDNELKIYDRSGNMVFRANGYNSSKFWDGQTVTSGTYIYILRVNIDGKDQFYKGSVTMLKN